MELISPELYDKLHSLCEQHSEIQRHYLCSDIAERLTGIIQHYKNVATNTLAHQKRFVEDMLVMLRAMSMVLEMVGNAGTHREKDARLRGCVELIETAIGKLRQQEFKISDSFSQLPDCFTSDYPVRAYLERIHDLEAELASIKPKEDAVSKHPDPLNPFIGKPFVDIP